MWFDLDINQRGSDSFSLPCPQEKIISILAQLPCSEHNSTLRLVPAELSGADQQTFTTMGAMLEQVIGPGVASLPVLLFGDMNRCFCGMKQEGFSHFLRLQGLPMTDRNRKTSPRGPIMGLKF